MKVVFASHNIYGVRHTNKASWLLRRSRVAKRLVSAKADVYALQECFYASEIKYLAKKLGYKYVLGGLGSAILYSPKFTKGRHWTLKIDRAHQHLIVELTKDRETINAVASHLPPFTTTAAQRARETAFRQLAGFVVGWSDTTLVGLDANWTETFETFAKARGFASARVSAVKREFANYRTHKTWGVGNAIDYVLVKGKRPFNILSYSLREKYGSDHHLVLTTVDTKPTITSV